MDMNARIRAALAEGRTREEVVAELERQGLSPVSARRFVERALAEQDPEWSAPGSRTGSVAASAGAQPEGAARRRLPFSLKPLLLGAAGMGVATAVLVGAITLRSRGSSRAPDEQAAVQARQAADDRRAERRRQRVEWAVGILRDSERHLSTVCRATAALGRCAATEALPQLQAVVNDTSRSSTTRLCAAGALAQLGDRATAAAYYHEGLQSGDLEVRSSAQRALAKLQP